MVMCQNRYLFFALNLRVRSNFILFSEKISTSTYTPLQLNLGYLEQPTLFQVAFQRVCVFLGGWGVGGPHQCAFREITKALHLEGKATPLL